MVLKFILILFFIITLLSCASKQFKPHYGSRYFIYEGSSNDFIVNKNSNKYSLFTKHEVDTFLSISKHQTKVLSMDYSIEKANHNKLIQNSNKSKKYPQLNITKPSVVNDTKGSGGVCFISAMILFLLTILFYFTVVNLVGIIFCFIFLIAGILFLYMAIRYTLDSIF